MERNISSNEAAEEYKKRNVSSDEAAKEDTRRGMNVSSDEAAEEDTRRGMSHPMRSQNKPSQAACPSTMVNFTC